MPRTSSISGVIFDLGAVLLDWNPQRVVMNFTEDPTEREMFHREIFRHPDWLEMDQGISSEVEVVERICSRTGISSKRVERLLSLIRDSLVPIPESHKLLEEAKDRGLKLYCLSNMSVETYERMTELHTFFEVFDGIVISGQEKIMKPDPAIFGLIQSRYRLPARQTLFIDDNADNVRVAKDQGFRAILFERTPTCFANIRSSWE